MLFIADGILKSLNCELSLDLEITNHKQQKIIYNR